MTIHKLLCNIVYLQKCTYAHIWIRNSNISQIICYWGIRAWVKILAQSEPNSKINSTSHYRELTAL